MRPSYFFLAALLAAAASADPAETAFEAKSNKLVEDLYGSRGIKIHKHEQEDSKESSKIHTKLDPNWWKGQQQPVQQPAQQPEKHEAVAPTAAATVPATAPATAAPTWAPTVFPTAAATVAATVPATVAPTPAPTVAPTVPATVAATMAPTVAPTAAATVAATVAPTEAPEVATTEAPVKQAAAGPTNTADLADSSTMQQDQLKTQRCAVCFIGQLRNLEGSAQSIHDNLLIPIAKQGGVLVDVFVAAEQGGPHTIADFDFQGEWGADISFIDSRSREHQTAWEIEEQLHKQNLPSTILAFYQRLNKGNWIGPMFGNPGNGMRVYRLEKDCIDMVREEEMKSQKSYSWVIRTRPDFKWLVPHPPLSLLTRDRVWILDGEHYDGVNNRHVVGSRDDVLKLLDRQRPIMEGDKVVYEMEVPDHKNDEYWMWLLGAHAGVEWGKLQYIGYLQKNPDWVGTGWRPSGGRYDNEHWTATNSQEDWQHKKQPCWKKNDWQHKIQIAECSKEGFIETRQSFTRGRLRR